MALRSLLRRLGVDRAIAFTVLNRGWSVLSGPLTLLFVVKFLSPEEQGFHYTFANIIGMQIFFELGLSGVILQFAAHEKANLEWTPQGTLMGDTTARARLAALLRKALKWYGMAALLAVLIVLPVGLWFFHRNQPTNVAVSWTMPWAGIVLTTAGALLISPILATLEGCGLVPQIATLRFCQAIAGTLSLWLALSLGWRLAAGPFCATAALIVSLFWLRGKWHFLSDLMRVPVEVNGLDWKREIWPFQWRIAVSWISGYFIGNLFNPILFAYHGAAAAGRMGLSINLAMAVWSLAFAWVSTKMAPFGSLIAKKDFEALDKLFFPCLWQAFGLAAVGAAMVWVGAFYLHVTGHPWSARLLEPLPLALLLMTIVISQITAAQGAYLRAHKQEPFLALSILSGVLVAAFAYFLGRPFGATGMMAGYCGTTALVAVLGTRIWQQKRRLWHGETRGKATSLKTA